MLIDDAWATIGSCNLHSNSLYGHSEMNATFYDPETVRALRVQLLAEHLATDTTDLDDRDALHLYRRIADANRAKGAAGDFAWQGLAFSLDPAAYGGERVIHRFRPIPPRPLHASRAQPRPQIGGKARQRRLIRRQ